MLARRDALPAAERRALSERITTRLLALDAYRGARCVMAYASFGGEFETADFIADVLAQGKALVLPAVERGSRSLQLHAVDDPARQLAPGVWGIPQPRADLCPRVPVSRLDFVLVPGVAFTPRCERLGYGGGYYDRLMPTLKPGTSRVAGAFDAQIAARIPAAVHDLCADMIVTESRVLPDPAQR